ncbi:MAG: class I SAM-dependent methyltransferase [Gaiellaceae bacterium]
MYELLVTRCGLRIGTHALEVGPGTGQATRRLLDLGASPLVALEPDPALAAYLRRSHADLIDVREVALEDAELVADTFDLAVAASSFHWVEEARGLDTLQSALRPGGWLAMWWTLFGVPGEQDAFIAATSPLLDGLDASPSSGAEGRPTRHPLDTEARFAALEAAGLRDAEHEVVTWGASWDTSGIRALYATFSPIARLAKERRDEILDGVAHIAEHDFGGHVERTLLTSIYTARNPV